MDPRSQPLSRRDALAATAVIGSCYAQSQETAASPSPTSEAILEALQSFDVPGAQICFLDPAKPPLHFAVGVADRSSGRALTSATRFEAASLSKPVFACTVLLLCEQRRLSLEAPLGDLLPAQDLPEDPRFRQVTVRQILTHSSGIQPVPPKGRTSKLMFAPGSRFAYSPHGFDFLQRAVERIARQPLSQLVGTSILEPLQMTESTFGWEKNETARAVGHAANNTRGLTINERVSRMTAEQRAALDAEYPLMNFPNAASSLITTARDYARFIAAAARPAPAGLLRAELAEELGKPGISAGQGVDWSLAFGLLRSKRHGLGLWHWGDFGVFQNFAVHFPAENRSLVSLTNGARGQRFNRAVAKLLLGEDLACFPWLRV